MVWWVPIKGRENETTMPLKAADMADEKVCCVFRSVEFRVSSFQYQSLYTPDVKHETSNVQLETDPLSVLMMAWFLLRQHTDIRHDVLHFPVGELASPRMHRAEDDAMLDGPQQFLIGFQERLEPLKICRWDFQRNGAWAITPAGLAVTVLTIVFKHGFPTLTVGRIVLRVRGGYSQTVQNTEAHEPCGKESVP